MQLSLNDLICTPPNEINREDILKNWNWLTNDLPVLFTALGDVFVQSDKGEVSFLDLASGSISSIAQSGVQFQDLLTDKEFLEDKFHVETLYSFRKAGKILKNGKCYSFKRPLILGGDEKIHNLKIRSIEDHVNMMGELHERIKDLPEDGEIEWDEN